MTSLMWRRAVCLSCCVLSLSTLLMITAPVGAQAPAGTQTAANQLVVVFDPQQDPRDVSQRLAQAGFSTTGQIAGLPPRFNNWRMVEVPNDASTRAKLMGVNGIIAVRPVYRAPGVGNPILTNGQIIVRFHPGTTVAQAGAIVTQAGCTLVRQIAGLPQAYVAEPNQKDALTDVVAAALKLQPEVRYAQPSILLSLQKFQQASIQDPLYVFQWHLRNTGQLPGGVAGADINVEEAWQTTLGNGAIVAVIDDCVQKDHEDLAANFLTGFDFVGATTSSLGLGALGGDGDPSPFFGPDPFTFGFFLFGDPVGEAHGTSTAGLICAAPNGVGGRGVAPNASLIGIKIGLGVVQSLDQDVADAFLFAERNGAMVVNNSWGPVNFTRIPVVPDTSYLLPTVISDAITEIATNGRGGKGVLVTFSAGNGDPLLFTPTPLPIDFGNIYASLDGVMAVGATLRDDRVACYSNFGPELSVMAPGGGLSVNLGYGTLNFGLGCYESDITTTDVMETPCFFGQDFDFDGLPDPGFPCRGYNPPMRFLDVFNSFCDLTDLTNCFILASDPTVTDFPQVNYTHHFNGTSAAAPVVSGVAALVFSVNADRTAEQVKNLIEHTADKVASTNEVFDAVTGHSDRYGHGRVNAGRAVNAAAAGQNWPSPVKNVQEVHSQTLARIFWENPANDTAGILVVRSTSQLDWTPVDGIAYQIGQQVTPNTVVVANDLITQIDQTGLPSGTFQYAVFVRNAQNFYSWGRRTGFAADDPVNKPVAAISASPLIGSVPLKVHFAGGAIDKSGIINYSWSFGDGSTGSGATIDHTYTIGGMFTATLTVTNAVGSTAQTTVIIKVSGKANALPTAAITASPTSGNTPLVVVFRATATDSDGFIANYAWNFGDGSTASGQTVEHIYLVPGTYGAILTVTDNNGGTSPASQVIMVTGTSPTAAATDPAGILNQNTGLCGLGTTGAMTMSLLGLALMAARRRF